MPIVAGTTIGYLYLIKTDCNITYDTYQKIIENHFELFMSFNELNKQSHLFALTEPKIKQLS